MSRKMSTVVVDPLSFPRKLPEIAGALRKGLLVAFPTETVYGLGAGIFREEGLKRIFRVKGRPQDNPLIVHVADLDMACQLLQRIPRGFKELAARFWPGPLTLVTPRNSAVSDLVTAGLNTVAIRMPAHPLALALLREAGVPVAAPSANLSGSPSPTTAADVLDDLDGRIPYLIDGGPCQVGIESTVLDLSTSRPRILRPGAISSEALASVLGCHVAFARSGGERPASPGMKYRHYAPRTPLLIVKPRRMASVLAKKLETHGRVGLIAPEALRSPIATSFFSLGPGEAVDYARLLYAALREMDRRDLDLVLIPEVGGSPLAHALMNRLSRAAGHRL